MFAVFVGVVAVCFRQACMEVRNSTVLEADRQNRQKDSEGKGSWDLFGLVTSWVLGHSDQWWLEFGADLTARCEKVRDPGSLSSITFLLSLGEKEQIVVTSSIL